MTIRDQDGNEITWEQFAEALRDAVAVDEEHDEEVESEDTSRQPSRQT